MDSPELEIESHWFYPPNSAYYLQRAQLTLQIRNNSELLQTIDRIECHFQCETDLTQYTPFVEPYITLDPHELSTTIFIDFEIDLALKSSTNRYQIMVIYSNGKVLRFDPRKHFLINSIRINPTFFVSHKEPQDTALCRSLKGMLFKVGIDGFLAEDIHYLGKDFWNDKIIPTIVDSVATVILFTENAERNPDKILKEIAISSANNKPLILALGPTVNKPNGFPDNIEYYRFQKNIDANELKQFVIWIFYAFRKGKYRKA